MSRIYDNILQPVGHTPLVRLSRLEQHFGTGAEIIAKLEKDRETVKAELAELEGKTGKKVAGRIKEAEK